MREYSFRFDEYFRKGIHPTKENRRNLVGADTIKGWQIGAAGLRPFQHVGINTESVHILDNGLSNVAFNWTYVTDGFSTVEVAPSERWDVADYGTYFISTNGFDIVHYGITESGRALVRNPAGVPRCTTLLDYNGQIFMGGISDWEDCTEAHVAWSEIGSASFEVGHLNTAGYAYLPGIHSIKRVLRLGEQVVVLGSGGIYLATPAREPAPTWGFRRLSGLGISSPWHADGDGSTIYFLHENRLMMLDSEGVKDLDFSHIFGGHEGLALVIDKQHSRLFISNDTHSWVLSSYGLSEVMLAPSSFANTSSGYIACGEILGNDSYLSWTSLPFDMDLPGIKTITSLNIEYESGLNDLEVAVSSMPENGRWITSPFYQLNGQNVLQRPFSGKAFKINLRTRDENTYISSGSVRFKNNDRRYIRGSLHMQNN